jgi:hypothetical protein
MLPGFNDSDALPAPARTRPSPEHPPWPAPHASWTRLPGARQRRQHSSAGMGTADGRPNPSTCLGTEFSSPTKKREPTSTLRRRRSPIPAPRREYHGWHGEEKVLSKPCRNNRSLPVNISRSLSWAWVPSGLGRAVSRLLRSISRSRRATSSAVLKRCLPLNRMCAQPWRAIDILWGGAMPFPLGCFGQLSSRLCRVAR